MQLFPLITFYSFEANSLPTADKNILCGVMGGVFFDGENMWHNIKRILVSLCLNLCSPVFFVITLITIFSNSLKLLNSIVRTIETIFGLKLDRNSLTVY